MKLKAIIFDVDGTLVDSNDIHARCWIEAFAQYYTALLGVGDLLEGSTSKHDAEHSKPSPEIF